MLAFASGDPAGVGPIVSVRAAIAVAGEEPVTIWGDGRQLQGLLEREGACGRISIADTGAVDRAAIERHAPDPICGASQLRSLDAAIAAVRRGDARALVTGPASKAAVAMAGQSFVGQTEHLARAAGLRDDEVTMLFLGPRLRLALVTTHLSVRDVPDAITSERVARTIVHLGEALVRLAGAGRPPSVAVASLNPHAGEGGMFGREEQLAIAPAIETARAREPFGSGRAAIAGLIPAETAIRRAADGAFDGVALMMHDQATIASKLLDWGSAVNVTWGLPFVRTSVDHGVAYDAAARGDGDAQGMIAAARMAMRLAP
jgi:4-hydroxythreonine-4-phosphate dehydrogenase